MGLQKSSTRGGACRARPLSGAESGSGTFMGLAVLGRWACGRSRSSASSEGHEGKVGLRRLLCNRRIGTRSANPRRDALSRRFCRWPGGETGLVVNCGQGAREFPTLTARGHAGGASKIAGGALLGGETEGVGSIPPATSTSDWCGIDPCQLVRRCAGGWPSEKAHGPGPQGIPCSAHEVGDQ